MKKVILVIDDSQAIRFLLQTVFAKSYDVVTAADGCSAMYWLTKRNLPDLIIADPQLPDMKEWELIENLTSSGLYGNLPLVILSSFDKKDTHTRCKEMGIKQFFMKPFNPVDLMKTADHITSNGKSKETSLKLV